MVATGYPALRLNVRRNAVNASQCLLQAVLHRRQYRIQAARRLIMASSCKVSRVLQALQVDPISAQRAAGSAMPLAPPDRCSSTPEHMTGRSKLSEARLPRPAKPKQRRAPAAFPRGNRHAFGIKDVPGAPARQQPQNFRWVFLASIAAICMRRIERLISGAFMVPNLQPIIPHPVRPPQSPATPASRPPGPPSPCRPT